VNINVRDENIHITIGDYVFVGSGTFFSTSSGIEIGDFSLIGRNCHFLNAGHTPRPGRPYQDAGIEIYSLMKIGANVWLTNQVTLIGGINIGFGSIIAAGSMVTKDVPPLAQAMGSPARLTKLYDWVGKAWEDVDKSTALEIQVERHLARCPTEEEYLAALIQSGVKPIPPPKAMGSTMGDVY
jgi:acetyltransferase-like isoleucine patch superfamily enzyme